MTELSQENVERHPHGEVRTEVVNDRVLVMTVDRVEKKNALTPKIMTELAGALTRLDEDPALWVGVLTFAGAHTTAGLEMPLFFGPDATPSDGREGLVDPFGLGRRLTKPLVTAVQGITFTIGIEIALAGDIVIAATDARLCQMDRSGASRRSVVRRSATWSGRVGAMPCTTCCERTSSTPPRRSASAWSRRSSRPGTRLSGPSSWAARSRPAPRSPCSTRSPMPAWRSTRGAPLRSQPSRR